MSSDTRPIGVFDSGVGGISVLRELIRVMPQENYLYFGDSANAPYGEKSTEQVRRLTMEAAQKLVDRNVKALVIACNTATAAAIGQLRQKYPQLIIVGIEPALKLAADRFPKGRIGVMATSVTLREKKFHQQAERFSEATILQIPAPGLVELIEQGDACKEQIRQLLERLLKEHVGKLDALVLGCTHYPFVADLVAQILGPNTVLLDGGEGTARQTKRCLELAGLLCEAGGSVVIENSSTDAELIKHSEALLKQGGA